MTTKLIPDMQDFAEKFWDGVVLDGSSQKRFDPSEHPRDSEGRFAEMGGDKAFDPSELRDEIGRWTDEASGGGGGGGGAIKFRLGKKLPADDLATIRDTIDRLGAKYPSTASRIKTVSTADLRTRWGSFSSNGQMKFTDIGGRYDEKYRDPLLEQTVAHEFGHALVFDLAGGVDVEDPPPRAAIRRGQISISDYNDRVRAYNAAVRETNKRRDEIVNDAYRRFIAPLFNERNTHAPDTYKTITEEFADNPTYYASDKEELLVAAFSHYETGQHGLIADAVGRWVQEQTS